MHGQLFFASSNDLTFRFDYAGDPAHVVIDLSAAHTWDASTVAVLDAVTTKYRARGTEVGIVGPDPDSRRRHEALAGLAPGHWRAAPGARSDVRRACTRRRGPARCVRPVGPVGGCPPCTH